MVRITEEIKTKMVELRKAGKTYREICEILGVKKERCIAYLKDIETSITATSAMTEEWKRAEQEANSVLENMDFSDIHDLNAICSSSPSWDMLAKKNETGKWWLIDVTINGQKSMAAKRDVIVDGYEHAILLKTESEWKLIKLTMNVEITVPI
jgi:hypothetical protein